ncbi:MAG: carboxypeptidase-like regulatory domain-containing protein, partial [Candidatus Hydrogenedentes bacterium]|nr:carboxypeptidase-like regulatory domain-containing protein [Candidatus Hydrogenedentota bacterium]
NTPTPVTTEDTVVARYVLTGTVLDKRTQSPVPRAHVIASRIPTESEETAFKEKDARIISEKDSASFGALIDEKQRLWADEGGQSNAKGRFKLAIVEEGDYRITVTSQAHLNGVVEKHFVGDTQPTWTVSIELSAGATISGRIYDGYDNQGVAGLTVNATLDNDYYQRHAQTDEEGRYQIGGLSPGTYAVIADIEKTAYRVTKELPFKRTTISGPDQAVTGMDFKLDKGGVVWGYVTTPDNDPVSADVLLCTSESILSQALSAMVRKAPPLHDNSNQEDGYYELVGVPLNEPWRLYATADESAPQLADPFILTERKKEARVDIFMFPGTNVYGQVVDSEGEGVPDAQIMCIPGYAQLLAPMDAPQAVRETRSDEEGFFEVRELPAGSYQVMAHKQGFKIALRGEPLYSDGYHEIKNFRVVLDNIEAGRYAVFGTVEDSSGAALSGARVVLTGLGTENLQGVDRDSITDGSGAFHIEGVEIGSYMLRAEYEGYSPKTLGRVLLDEPNRIVMETSSYVRGRVLAKATNTAPEGGYTVTATLLERAEEEESGILSFLANADGTVKSEQFNDPQGNYKLTLSSGTWQLEGSATGLTPKRVTVTMAPGETQDNIDIILTRDGGSIRGTLRISDGKSPQGATVSLLESSNVSQALTDFAQEGGQHDIQVGADGFFSFEQLPEGTYYAIARHPAYPQAMSEVLILEAEGSIEGVEIRMGPGGTLEGFVYDNGKPMEGWVVTVIANGAPYTATSDRLGAYRIENIPAGSFQAFASNPTAALGGNPAAGQGEPIVIEDGLVTYKNFGEIGGITIHVTIAGTTVSDIIPVDLTTIGGLVSLSPATSPPNVGANLLRADLPNESYTVISGTITISDVATGTWRVDYYAGQTNPAGTYTWRSFGEVEVTGEEQDIEITLMR